MSYIIGLLNSNYSKYIIIILVGFGFGYMYGMQSNRIGQLNQALKVAAVAKKQIEEHQIVVHKILNDKEIALVKLGSENGMLRGKLKRDEKIINDTNVIKRNWLRAIGAAKTAPKLQSNTVSVISKNSATNGLRYLDDDRIPAADVARYIIYIKEHDQNCMVNNNALIDVVK